MLFEFKECKDRFGSVYQIEKAMAEHCLSQQDVGVYSDTDYLSQSVKQTKLKAYIVELTYEGKRCKISTYDELMRMTQLVFGMKTFVRKLNNTRVDWFDVSPREMLGALATFLNGLK